MKLRLPIAIFVLSLVPPAMIVLGQQQARVEMFSPQGTVQRVRQVQVRFSEAMVPFGDLREELPFDIHCSEQGTARWADDRNWIFDFDRDLEAGVPTSDALLAVEKLILEKNADRKSVV